MARPAPVPVSALRRGPPRGLRPLTPPRARGGQRAAWVGTLFEVLIPVGMMSLTVLLKDLSTQFDAPAIAYTCGPARPSQGPPGRSRCWPAQPLCSALPRGLSVRRRESRPAGQDRRGRFTAMRNRHSLGAALRHLVYKYEPKKTMVPRVAAKCRQWA